jgi:hypothetical protein
MSHYFRMTKHPVTGRFEIAEWYDSYFGGRTYGVRFLGDDHVYNELEHDWEFADNVALEPKSGNGARCGGRASRHTT